MVLFSIFLLSQFLFFSFSSSSISLSPLSLSLSLSLRPSLAFALSLVLSTFQYTNNVEIILNICFVSFRMNEFLAFAKVFDKKRQKCTHSCKSSVFYSFSSYMLFGVCTSRLLCLPLALGLIQFQTCSKTMVCTEIHCETLCICESFLAHSSSYAIIQPRSTIFYYNLANIYSRYVYTLDLP